MSISVYRNRGADELNSIYSVYGTPSADRHSNGVTTPASNSSDPHPSAPASSRTGYKGSDAVDDGSLESRMVKLEKAMDTIASWRQGEKRKEESSWWKERVLEETLLKLEARVSCLEGSNGTHALASDTLVVPAESQEKAIPVSTDLVQWREDMEAKVDEMVHRADQAVINMGHSHFENNQEKSNKTLTSVDEVLKQHMNYHWETSVYDGLLIAFLPNLRISILQSLLIISGFIVNSLMLVVIISIVGDREFNRRSSLSLDSLQQWRNSDGHSHFWAHPSTSVTLVNRVCNLDETLSFGTEQKLLVEEIDQYKSHGWRLCNVAIILWSFCCCGEVRSAMRFGAAVWHVERGAHTEVSETGEGDIKFTMMSWPRAVVALAVACARAAFAFSLMFWGGVYLAYITSIEDLLLNASALGFVLDIDNVIFSVLAPLRAIGCLQNLRPEPITHTNFMNFLPMALTIGIAVNGVYLNIASINPNIRDMDDAKQILCEPSESLQYTITRDSLGRILYTEDTPVWTRQSSGVQTILNVREEIKMGLLQQSSDARKQAILIDRLQDFNEMASWNLEELVNSYPCADNNTLDESTTVGHRLFAVTGVPDVLLIDSCATASSFCYSAGDMWSIGSNVRLMCPMTCGCARAHAGLWDLARAYNGCPWEKCARKMESALKRFSYIKCRDMDLSQARTLGWDLLLERLRETRTIREDLFLNLTTQGCDALIHVPSSYGNGKVRDICSMNAILYDHGMAPFCPVSCRCATAKDSVDALENCPGLCPSSCCNV